MRRLVVLLLLLLCPGFARLLPAQVVDASVCDILASPQSFDGKTVRVKGTVIAGFDEFTIKDTTCNRPVNAIWLAYPSGTKGKAGPVAFLQLQLSRNNSASPPSVNRSSVKLEKNSDFKEFDSLLSTPYKGGAMCLGCVRYTVTATLVGRLDGSASVGVGRDGTGKYVSVDGFGNLNRYSARFVLQSVSDITSQEIDYSKAAPGAKDDSQSQASGGDPFSAVHEAARAFGASSAQANLLEAAAAAFGKQGEDNGVSVGFGIANEVPSDDGPKGRDNSPDGLLFHSMFDPDRLKGAALSRAISHVGTHIADLRSLQPGAIAPTLYELEYHAWQAVVLNAVANKQSALILPGSFLIWNSAWPDIDRGKLMDQGLSGFLQDWDALPRPVQR